MTIARSLKLLSKGVLQSRPQLAEIIATNSLHRPKSYNINDLLQKGLAWQENHDNNIVDEITRELSIRLSHHIIDVHRFENIVTMPPYKDYFPLLLDDFQTIFVDGIGDGASTAAKFNMLPKIIINRFLSFETTIGIFKEFYAQIGRIPDIQQYFEHTSLQRMGLITLCSHFSALHSQMSFRNTNATHRPKNQEFVGIVKLQSSLRNVLRAAAQQAMEIQEHLNIFPDIEIECDPKYQLKHITFHLEYMLCEIFKNSIRGILERYPLQQGSNGQLPPIIVQVEKCEGNLVRVSIKDEGCGISKDDMDKIWQFGYSGLSSIRLDKNIPSNNLSGYGFGLPMARLYTQYYGGNLTIQSELNKGTVVSMLIRTDGSDYEEPIPLCYDSNR